MKEKNVLVRISDVMKQTCHIVCIFYTQCTVLAVLMILTVSWLTNTKRDNCDNVRMVLHPYCPTV